MIVIVSIKFINIADFIILPARGFLPRASILLLEIRPNEMKPKANVNKATKAAQINLNVVKGVINGTLKAARKVSSIVGEISSVIITEVGFTETRISPIWSEESSE